MLYFSKRDLGKEHLIFIDSLNKLHKHLLLAILGSPYENGLTYRMKLLPKLSFESLMELYRNMDLFVHTNSREPFGLVLLEAIA